jgi:hypothetical protein
MQVVGIVRIQSSGFIHVGKYTEMCNAMAMAMAMADGYGYGESIVKHKFRL